MRPRMTEPALDLNCVAAFREQDRGAGMTERGEADPQKACGPPRPLCSRVVLMGRCGEQRIEGNLSKWRCSHFCSHPRHRLRSSATHKKPKPANLQANRTMPEEGLEPPTRGL